MEAVYINLITPSTYKTAGQSDEGKTAKRMHLLQPEVLLLQQDLSFRIKGTRSSEQHCPVNVSIATTGTPI